MLLHLKHMTRGAILWTLCLTFFQVGFAGSTLEKNYQIEGLSGSLKRLIDEHLEAIPFNASITSPIKAVESKHTIQQILEAYGYFHSEITSHIKTTPQGDYITYTIKKGAQLQITQLNLQVIGEGASNQSLQKTLKTLSAKQGSAMITESYQKIKEQLYQSAISEGYLDATWKTHTIAIDLKNHTAVITLALDTKPRYTVGSIQFLNNPAPLSTRFIKNYLGFQEGSPYRLKQILSAQTHLQASHYFQEAFIEIPATHNTYQMPLHLTLKPASKYYTVLSLGLRSDLGMRFKAEGLIRYLNAKGHQLSGLLETSTQEFNALAAYKIPGALPSVQQHLIQLEYKSQYPATQTRGSNPISAYCPTKLPSENPTALLQYLYVRQYPTWKLISSLCLHHEHFKPSQHQAPKAYHAVIPGLYMSKKRSYSGSSSNYYKLSLEAKGAIPSFSEHPFLKLEGKGAYFIYLSPLLAYSYLILRGHYGKLFTESLQTVPTSLRFYAGGYCYPRGHKKYSVGSHTIGSGAEMRLHLTGLFYFNPFLEMNWDKDNQSTRGSTGAGLCLWYPHIGTIEISGVRRINPAHPQGNWGLIAKISTSLE